MNVKKMPEISIEKMVERRRRFIQGELLKRFSAAELADAVGLFFGMVTYYNIPQDGLECLPTSPILQDLGERLVKAYEEIGTAGEAIEDELPRKN